MLENLQHKPVHLIANIPREEAAVRFLTLPSVNDFEISQMVNYQAPRQILYSKDEMIFDYQVIEKTEKGHSHVALIIVHRDTVNRHLEIMNTFHLEPEFITLSTISIFNWFLTTQEYPPHEKAPPVAIIDINYANTEILVSIGLQLIFSRGVPIGISHLTEKNNEKYRLKFSQEISRSFDTFHKEQSKIKINKILLTSQNETIRATLSEDFSLPVETLDLFHNLVTAESSTLDEVEQGISLASVLGSALCDPPQINLLPPHIQRKRQEKKKKKEYCKALSLLATILCLGIFLVGKSLYDKEQYLKELDRKLKKIAPVAEEIETMEKKVTLITKHLNVENSSIEILRELYEIVPHQITLSTFTFQEGKLVTLRGTSQAMSDVFTFINVLENSPYFQNVQIRYARKRKVKNKEITDFQISCPLLAHK
jgi:Tfp pilus assembly PilM family ATPase/Tfp pilus assembly protein PilN